MKFDIKFSKYEILLFITSLIGFMILGFLFLEKFPHYHLYRISGYDPFFTGLIKNPIESASATIRHPLFGLYMLPFSFLYILLKSDLLILMIFALLASSSYLLIFKIGHEVVGITKTESFILSTLFILFAQILTVSIVPESYPFSLFFLSLSLYCLGRNFENNITIKTYFILFFLTAGTTITNGIKVLISIFFTNFTFKKKLFWISCISLAFLLVITPVYIISRKLAQTTQNSNSVVISSHESEQIKINNKSNLPGFAKFINFNEPFFPSLIENFIGESLLFHDADLAIDVTRGRSVTMPYKSKIKYIITISLFILFLLGFILNRKNKFVVYLFCFWLVDIFIHLICRFGFDEPYIFSSHWLMLIPIVLAYLLKISLGWKYYTLMTYFIVMSILIGYSNLNILCDYLLIR